MTKTATAPRYFQLTMTSPEGIVKSAISPARFVDATLARARKERGARITPTATGGVVITRKVWNGKFTVAVEPIAD